MSGDWWQLYHLMSLIATRGTETDHAYEVKLGNDSVSYSVSSDRWGLSLKAELEAAAVDGLALLTPSECLL